MHTSERRDQLLNAIRHDGYVNVREKALQMAVDVSTLRRDLHQLETMGLVQRKHGGAVPVRDGDELPLLEKMRQSVQEKRAIAQAIAARVPTGATVLLDSGSTCLNVARALRDHRGLTIITPDVRTAAEIIDVHENRLVVPGGEAIHGTSTLLSQDALSFIQRLHVDVAVLCADAIDERGPSNLNNAVIPLKRAMIDAAAERILAIDSSKLGQRKLFPVAELDEFSLLVTDWRPTDLQLKGFSVPVERAPQLDAGIE